MINERIDEFTFLSKIGEGGMATVYKAFDNNFKEHVAIKVLKSEFVNHKNVRARFIAEARKLYKLSHKNIIKVRRIIDAGDVVAFVMELVSGATLKEYVEQNAPLKRNKVEEVFKEMLTALSFVHKMGFVHRDVKPSNFMITLDGRLLLLDFGIAKDVDGNSDYTATGTNYQMGTPSYMSPEQIRNSKGVDQRSDIYSLGVVLFFMVNGKGPYEASNMSLFDLFTKIVNEPIPKSSTVWDDVIQKMTEKTLEKRYSDCSEIPSKIKLSNRIINDKKHIREMLINFLFSQLSLGILILVVVILFSSIPNHLLVFAFPVILIFSTIYLGFYFARK
jgi:serine/threonine protein kinase